MDEEQEQPKFRSVATLDDMFVDGPVDKDDFGPADVVRAIGGMEVDNMVASGLDWGMESMEGFSHGFHSDRAGNMGMGFMAEKNTAKANASGRYNSGVSLPFDPTDYGLPPLDSMMSGSSSTKTTSWDANFSIDDYGAHSPSDCSGPRELRPFPLHYQKYHSFYTSFPACDIVAEIDRLLQKSSCLDYTLDAQKHKFKGVARMGPGENARFWFVIKLFKGRNPGEILVEIQKRGGDCVGFNCFFKATVAQLSPFVLRRGCICEGADENLDAWLSCAAEAAKRCPVYNLQDATKLDTPLQTQDSCELLETVLEMITGDAAHNEHRIGMNVLSSLANNDPSFLAHLNDAISEKEDFDLAQALQRSFDTQSNFVADEACSLVAAICEQASSANACDGQKELCNEIVSTLLNPLFAVLDAPMRPGDVETAHSKRQVVRALACLPQEIALSSLCEEDVSRCAEVLKQLQTECRVRENDAKAGVDKVTYCTQDSKYQKDILMAQRNLKLV